MIALAVFAVCVLNAEPLDTYKLYKTVDSTTFMSFFNFDTHDYNHGNVQYVPADQAKSLNMLRFNNNQIYMGAEMNSWGKRKSIKVLSKETFNKGLFIMDAKHMPAGCGTWPAWWLTGPSWPNAGEIDIIEQVNTASQDATTLHTSKGCYASGKYTGHLKHNDCYALANGNAGCGITSPDKASFGSAFNSNGGGSFALLWDDSGIKAWFWQPGHLPSDILAQNPKPSSWGTPYAAFDFGSSCPSSHFHDLTMVINTNFCGDWAGGTFAHDCPGKGSCTSYTNNPASAKEAYWLVNYIDIYRINGGGGTYCCLDRTNHCINDPWCNAQQSRCEGPCNANHDHHWGPAPSVYRNSTYSLEDFAVGPRNYSVVEL